MNADQSDLDAPARGMLNGCLLSAVLWAVIGLVVWSVMT